MKYFLLLCFTLFSSQAFASSYETKITNAKCDLVAKTGSTVGTVVGGTTGAVVGAAAGKALFGKGWGSALGGLVGGAAGGYAGNEMGAEKTYHCILEFTDRKNKTQIAEVVSMKPYTVNQIVTVFEASDGTVKVK